MIDLNNLNTQLSNLKDLDSAQLIKLVSENQNTIIKVVLIIGTLFLLGSIFSDHRSKEQGLKTQIAQEQDKLGLIQSRDSSLADLNNFKSTLPSSINEFELIGLISQFAKTYNISIPSLSPGGSQDMGLYDAISINFNGVSDNFKDMVLFLRKIEKSHYPLRIDSWSGREGDNGGIEFQIKISAILLHT